MATPRLTASLVAALATVLPLVASEASVAEPTAPTFVPVAGNIVDIVTDGRGRALAANDETNQVEVLDLATRALGDPIALDSQPLGIDISPDGTTLYVVSADSHDLSVIDLSTGPMIDAIDLRDQPDGLAVADNGTALYPVWGEADFHQVDLATGEIVDRGPVVVGEGDDTFRAQHLVAKQDHSRILVFGGAAAVYDSASDAFGPARTFFPGPIGAVDGSGSTVVLGGALFTIVTDGSLNRTAFDMGAGFLGSQITAIAVNASGTTAYRVRRTEVDVIDLTRHLVTGTIPLTDPAGGFNAVALSHDESTIVVGTQGGLGVSSVSSSEPVPACDPSSPAPTVAGICGETGGVVVSEQDGIAYVTNTNRNQVEVVSLETAMVEASIAVGSHPIGLDLSADGSILYVATWGAESVSVVDTASREEVGRIPIEHVAHPWMDGPYSIAVADDGTVLLSTSIDSFGGGTRVLQLDPGDEAFEPRPEFGTGGEAVPGGPSNLRASTDRSLITGVDSPGSGPTTLAVYTSGTDAFAPSVHLESTGTAAAAADSGSPILTVPGTVLFDADLVRLGRIAGAAGGHDVAVDASGQDGFVVTDSSIEVLDLHRMLESGSIDLPESVGTAKGQIAATHDGSKLAVLTESGLSVVGATDVAPAPECEMSESPPDGVVPVCLPLFGDVVFGDSGHIYASNLAWNQVEVVSVADGTLEASIPVGSAPGLLDIDADGDMLYVVNSQAQDISVVDLATREEVRRISISMSPADDRPMGIAVLDGGIALVTTNPGGSGGNSRLLKVDLDTDGSRSSSS